MNHDPQLMAHLKQLKLSGILESLDMRLSQAITEQLSCADFLQRLIEDEVERRHRRQLDTRLRRAAFQPDKTLERFDFSFNPQLNRQLIMELATCQFVARKQPLLIVGPSGVGKSHLAQALGWEACKRGYEVMHTNCAKLLAALAAVAQGGFHWPQASVGWWALAALTFLYGTGFTIMFTVLPRLGVVGNSAIMNIEPIFALVLAWAVLGQHIAAVQVAGGLLVVATVVWLGLRRG